MIINYLFILFVLFKIIIAEVPCGKPTPNTTEDCNIDYSKDDTSVCCFFTGTTTFNGITTAWKKCDWLLINDTIKAPYFTEYEYGKTKVVYDFGGCGSKTATASNKVCRNNYVPTSLSDCSIIKPNDEGSNCCFLKGKNGKNLCVWSEPNSTVNYNYLGLNIQCTDSNVVYKVLDNLGYNYLVKKKVECGKHLPTNNMDCLLSNSGDDYCCYSKYTSSNNGTDFDSTPKCVKMNKNTIVTSDYYSDFENSEINVKYSYTDFDCGDLVTTMRNQNESSIRCGPSNKKPQTLSDCLDHSSKLQYCCMYVGKTSNMCGWVEYYVYFNYNLAGLKVKCKDNNDYQYFNTFGEIKPYADKLKWEESTNSDTIKSSSFYYLNFLKILATVVCIYFI